MDHYNIVKYKHFVKSTFGRTDQYHIIMDLAKGDDLGYHIKKNGPAGSIETIREVGRQLLSAISYLHSKMIIHLDIKPSNVMFS